VLRTKVADQLAAYLAKFDSIVELYRRWAETALQREGLDEILRTLPVKASEAIDQSIEVTGAATIYGAYNVATDYATHQTRNYRTHSSFSRGSIADYNGPLGPPRPEAQKPRIQLLGVFLFPALQSFLPPGRARTPLFPRRRSGTLWRRSSQSGIPERSP